MDGRDRAIGATATLRLGTIAVAIILLVDSVAPGRYCAWVETEVGVDLGPNAVVTRSECLLLARGATDETGHLLTALIWVCAAVAGGLRIRLVPALVAGVAIDLDHLPMVLGLLDPPSGTTRPVTHALPTVLTLLTLALVHRRGRATWLAAAIGAAAHLGRDLGTGTVLLWWPASTDPVAVRYEAYVASTSALVLVTVLMIALRRDNSAQDRHVDGARQG